MLRQNALDEVAYKFGDEMLTLRLAQGVVLRERPRTRRVVKVGVKSVQFSSEFTATVTPPSDRSRSR